MIKMQPILSIFVLATTCSQMVNILAYGEVSPNNHNIDGGGSRGTTYRKCPEGTLLGLDGQCIRKFVIPKRKKCIEPTLKFGGHELMIGGRVVNYWCEEGWTLVPADADSAVCKVGKCKQITLFVCFVLLYAFRSLEQTGASMREAGL